MRGDTFISSKFRRHEYKVLQNNGIEENVITSAEENESQKHRRLSEISIKCNSKEQVT